MPARPTTVPTAPDPSAADRAAARGTPAGAGRAAHLSVDGVSVALGERRVLTDITVSAAPGDRIGLVGENGTGKSTLLRLIAGRLPADAGTVARPATVGLLEQELPFPDTAPVSRVLDDAQRASLAVLGEIERLSAALADRPDDASLADAYADALERAERGEAWAAEARRGELLTGLGIAGVPEDTPVGRLSGGQRLRLALAAVLLEAPHTLLLDEPSNHLDDASAAYLERVLARWPGIVIVASHDRALLDAVATRILDLDPLPVPARLLGDAAGADTCGAQAAGADGGAGSAGDAGAGTDDPGAGFGLRLWGVGYSAARDAREAELARWRARYAAETAERDALVHEIEVGSREVNRKHESKSEAKITRKFYADKDARVTSRRARNARVRLEALERERVRRPPEPLRFGGFAGAAHDGGSGPGPARAPGRRGTTVDAAAPNGGERPEPLLRARAVAVAGRLAETSLELPPGGRILLTGPNGSGKSTLLAALAGELDIDRGAIERRPGTRVGYLPQEIAFADPRRTAAEVYAAAVGPGIAEARPLAATGLLAPRDADRPVGRLSVGQRRRVALAALAADPPDVLLLDEPTNHLSLALVEELEAALHAFPGAVVVATHDRWMRSRWRGAIVPL